MYRTLRQTASVVAVIASAISLMPERVAAQSYQIDCAILLCLSGGWSASAPCARARTEFIRRITPWPVEPPLQIWRCPMGAAFTIDPDALTPNRIYDILLELGDGPHQSYPSPSHTQIAVTPQPAVVRRKGGSSPRLPDDFVLQLIQNTNVDENGTADIDISGAEFNFVRSIRVFNVTNANQYESGSEGDCEQSFALWVGTYGTQGDFSWARGSNPTQLPPDHVGLDGFGTHCPRIYHRSVFVDWRDYEGNYGFEQVNY